MSRSRLAVLLVLAALGLILPGVGATSDHLWPLVAGSVALNSVLVVAGTAPKAARRNSSIS